MSIYVKIDGIDGAVSAKGHEKWIEVNSFNFGVNRNIRAALGSGGNREATKPTVSEIILEKETGPASPHIFLETCIGKAKDKVLIDVCHTGDKIKPYLQFTLENVLISRYTLQAASQDKNAKPKESIALHFTKVEMKYIPYDKKNKQGSPVPVGYDLETARSV